MNNKYEKIIGWLAGLIVLGILLWGFMSSMENKAPVVPEPEPVQATPQIQTLEKYLNAPRFTGNDIFNWKEYENQKFSIQYPNDFILNANYKNQTGAPGQEILGVSFTIPASMAAGTNLSKDTLISVEEHPESTRCEARDYVYTQLAPSQAGTVVVGDATYTVAETDDAAAGNRYHETILAVPGTPCRTIRLFVHSTNIDNYDPGTVKEFNREALLSIFATMAASYDAK